jgi:membrane protein
MGLVYTTLISLVPLLAVSFSVLKAFGVQNTLEPFLLDLVTPLGENGPMLARRIVEFVDNIQVGVLGTVGLALLMYTVLSLIQKIEQAFNVIWRVRGLRSVIHQFSEYLSVVLVGPVLVVSALALTASFMSTSLVQRLVEIEPFGTLVAAAGRLVPYVLVCASFTFLYLFLPNTRVRFSSALLGGVIGGVLWQTLGWGFASFIVASTKYAAIYSSFAILILFMTWLYLSWLILLVGADVSFYYQNPQLLSIAAEDDIPNARLIEQTAVSIMFLVASHFYHDRPPWSVNAMVERLGITIGRIEDALAALRKKGLLRETADEPPTYVPGRDLEQILLQDVYDAVRWRTPEAESARPVIAPIDAVVIIENDIDRAINNALRSQSLKDIVRSEGADRKKLAA